MGERRRNDRAARGEFLIYTPRRVHNVNPPFASRAAALVFACGLRTFSASP
jgi:hypothetical protein